MSIEVAADLSWVKKRQDRWQRQEEAEQVLAKLCAEGTVHQRTDKLRCTSLKRWPKGTDYVQIVGDVLGLPADLIVPDYCGVGRPFVDMLRREAMRRNYRGKIRPVLSIGSHAKAASTRMEARGLSHNVPKIELVMSLKLLMEQKRLEFPAIPEMQDALKEVGDFQQRITKAANYQFGNIEKAGRHDDYISALSLGAWAALNVQARRLSVVV